MVPRYQKISLNIEDMQLGENCEDNYVLVRDGMTSEAKSLGKFCTQQRDVVITSVGNSMWVEMRSSCATSKSFRAYWSAVASGEFPDDNKPVRNKAPGVVVVNKRVVSGAGVDATPTKVCMYGTEVSLL